MKKWVLVLVAFLLFFAFSARAEACQFCVQQRAVQSVQMPGYVLPVRVVVLDNGMVVPRRPVVLAARRVVQVPLRVTRRVVRVPLVVGRRAVRLPVGVVRRVFCY